LVTMDDQWQPPRPPGVSPTTEAALDSGQHARGFGVYSGVSGELVTNPGTRPMVGPWTR